MGTSRRVKYKFWPFNSDECGQVDTYWRGQLTSATYFGLLLLHWTVGEFAPDMNSTTSNGDTHVANTLLAAVLGNTSADNGWKLAAQISNSSVVSEVSWFRVGVRFMLGKYCYTSLMDS